MGQLEELLQQKGYQPVESGVYVREAEEEVYAVTVSMPERDLQAAAYDRLRARLEFQLSLKYHKPVRTLHLLLIRDAEGEDELVQRLVSRVSGLWLISGENGRVYRYENQPCDFDGLYHVLEDGLISQQRQQTLVRYAFTPVNMAIVACNLVYFITVIVLNGGYASVYDTDIMLRMGALSVQTFLEGAWYQVVTSMFLHFGWRHLFNNMVLLTYVGCELERRIGSPAYAVLYLVSGVCGNIASVCYYMYAGDVVSAGASGAVFGVIGALFVVLLFFRSESETLTASRLVAMTVITIYYGLTTAGVDNAAHIGGLISGIIGGFLLSKILQYGKLKRVTL